MRLAVNYTPQAAQLLATGAITFDLFKCPDWPEVIEAARRHRPVYVHFSLLTRQGLLEAVDWAQLETLLEQTGTRCVNLHIAPHSGDFAGLDQDTRDPVWFDRLAEYVLACMQPVLDRFGADRVIVENSPWDPDPQYAIPRPIIEPPFISRILAETGCGLLLDTAHARIAALHLEMDQIAYLDAMPVAKLREVHVTGTRYDQDAGCWRDHFAMTEEDWPLIGHALNRIEAGDWPQPEIVTLEYGGVGPLFNWRSQPEVIARDLPRLHDLVRAVRRRQDLTAATS